MDCTIDPRCVTGRPVSETTPPVVARPKAWVSQSNSPHLTPPSARTVRRPGSTRTPFIRARSMTMPPSQTELPATLWPL